jgi:energy-coupling factor transporter ATP-binding protein EcfA2
MKQGKEVSTKTSQSSISNYNLPYYVSGDIYKQLLNSKKIVHGLDQDRIYVVDGREGLGKSKLARQLAYVVDPTISLDRIVFDSKSFEKCIMTCKKHKAIIFDECFRGLSNKSSLSKENKRLVELLMECRQRNLFVFLVLPSFFLLEKYAAIFRSSALFHVMVSSKNPKLRYYKVYNYKQKKILYLLGKQLMEYGKPRVPFSHRFYDKEVPTIDYKEYIKKKLKAFQETKEEDKGMNKLEDRFLRQRNAAIILLNKRYKVTQKKIAQEMREINGYITEAAISRLISDANLKPDFR